MSRNFLFFFLVGALVFVVFYLSSSEKDQKRPIVDQPTVQKKVDAPVTWEPIRYPVYQGGVRPTVPTMHVIPGGQAEVQQQFGLRVQQLVEQNVAPEVATRLHQLMSKHIVRYGYGWSMSEFASFVVRGGIPYINFDGKRGAALDSTKSPEEILLFMSVIAHEFVHYEQWSKSDDAEFRATFEEGFSNINDEVCAFSWRSEREAYHHQCTLLMSWGMGFTFGGQNICLPVLSDAAFDQRLFWALANNMPPRLRHCVSIWARLAGAPENYTYHK